MLPLGPIERTYATRLLAVGDAAGLVKATTGGGIYYSLLSGRLAADVLADALQTGDPQLTTSIANALGVQAIRIVVPWTPGETTLSGTEEQQLDNAVVAIDVEEWLGWSAT